jgi:ABC-type cobalamin/Fe3+-siderophores transport system ATPase subunit
MPVPISVTHPKSKGLASHVSNQVETAGPFARLKQQQSDAPSTTPPAAPLNEPQQPASPANGGPNGAADHEASVVVDNLNFSYPGLGAFCFLLAIQFVWPHCCVRALFVLRIALAMLCACAADCVYISLHCPIELPARRGNSRGARARGRCARCRTLPPADKRNQPKTNKKPKKTDGRPIPGAPPLITDMSLRLAPGSRVLLLGANGAGKTTLLKALGGKHMVPPGAVRVLGRSPFHDTGLTTSGDLAYVGGNWTRDIAFAGTSVPLTVRAACVAAVCWHLFVCSALSRACVVMRATPQHRAHAPSSPKHTHNTHKKTQQGDFPASQMIDAVHGADPARKARLIDVLDIDPAWRMHQVSDGQRRRVQICVGLLRPFKVGSEWEEGGHAP